MRSNNKHRRQHTFTKFSLLSLIMLFIIFSPKQLIAQNAQTVKGTVTDNKGNPAAGVTVSVKGGETRTLTDESGSFTILAPPNATLSFSSVNFDLNEVRVIPGQVLSIVLNEK